MANKKYAFDHEPSLEELSTVLKDIPAWPGSGKTLGVNYPEYVVAIEQRARNKPTIWLPYVTVDGRVTMFHDAHNETGKKFTEHIIPPVFHAPGSVSFEKFMIVSMRIDSELLGSREDMAVALVGGDTFSADTTNPAENAMTSVRGRVLAAFGFGIIPTMGMASADEVKTAINAKNGIVSNNNEDAPAAQEAIEKPKKAIKKLVVPKQKNSEDVGVAQEPNASSENDHTRALLNKAIDIAKTDEATLIAEHIKRRSGQVELTEEWTTWPLAEVIKMQTTAREMKG